MHYLPDTPLRLARRVPDLGAQQRTFRDFDTFSTFKGPQYAPTPSKTALTTAPTQVIVRCILKLPAHAQWQHWQRSRCSRWGMLLTVVDEWSSTSAASPASAASLHGSNPLSLMFSSFQLPREGFARLAQAQLQHPEHA